MLEMAAGGRMNEIWKDIANFEGFYKISNTGKVKSLARNGTVNYDKILSPGKNKDGYLRVVLNKNGNKRYVTVHRLVAETFLDNQNDYPQIDHIDGNKQNNNVHNLRFCSSKTNCNNINTLCKLCKRVIQIDKSNCVINTFTSTREAEKITGIFHNSISRCCNLKQLTAGGYCWKYVEEVI